MQNEIIENIEFVQGVEFEFLFLLKSNRTEQKFQSEVWSFSLNETAWKHRRDVLASVNGLQLMKAITALLINDLF